LCPTSCAAVLCAETNVIYFRMPLFATISSLFATEHVSKWTAPVNTFAGSSHSVQVNDFVAVRSGPIRGGRQLPAVSSGVITVPTNGGKACELAGGEPGVTNTVGNCVKAGSPCEIGACPTGSECFMKTIDGHYNHEGVCVQEGAPCRYGCNPGDLPEGAVCVPGMGEWDKRGKCVAKHSVKVGEVTPYVPPAGAKEFVSTDPAVLGDKRKNTALLDKNGNPVMMDGQPLTVKDFTRLQELANLEKQGVDVGELTGFRSQAPKAGSSLELLNEADKNDSSNSNSNNSNGKADANNDDSDSN